MDHVWTCRCCGKQFDTLPLSFAPVAPDPWFAVPEAERSTRSQLSSDACVIDGKDFFIRGCLEIPILGREDVFIWGVWVSVAEPSFERIGELWGVDLREHERPFFGWLCTEISVYPRTFGLKTNVHLRNHGKRPYIELEPTDHPLALEQRAGISLQRLEEIASTLLQHH
ncbi:MAG: DUF2199 domain-containing protein [Xanthobacteraceae bacterium]